MAGPRALGNPGKWERLIDKFRRTSIAWFPKQAVRFNVKNRALLNWLPNFALALHGCGCATYD
jgi:hypothetical protein